MSFLALDWAKVFDSISPEALVQALARFGRSGQILEVIRTIYTDRVFCVRDAGNISQERRQAFGISQGCPLSPFLFTMVMTILIWDASRKLHGHHLHRAADFHLFEELLYADDTRVVNSSPVLAAFYMDKMCEEGAHYGLSFNWAKLEVLNIRNTEKI